MNVQLFPIARRIYLSFPIRKYTPGEYTIVPGILSCKLRPNGNATQYAKSCLVYTLPEHIHQL
jgi:hypothetical protein